MKCLNCGIEFTPQRKTAQFHDPKCRVAYSRKKSVEALPGYIKPNSTPEEILAKVQAIKGKKEKSSENIHEPKKPQFVPNWKRLGLKSKEEGIGHVIKHLFSDADRITSKGLTNSTTITVGDTVYTISGKKRKKK